ncbi:OmpA family protein [Flagellimonas sp. HMM57]|uniref:OmpA family protein n=1 Tax=unclassified Flagellimonas TaxID=2644544 RepID=UPI0013D66636|nr:MULTISPECIES: OmpA family protein [unclassified Flagellimonas]UII76936.1 OmpA family protein [Flagellimonas sp. HMM57]
MVQARNIFVLLLSSIFGMAIGYAQAKKSKGDAYFFQYNYKQAVIAYEEDLQKGTLTEQQFLNLADAYFKTDNFEKASEAYLKLYEKDTLIGNHELNKLIRSLSKIGDKTKTTDFFTKISPNFDTEFLENLEFNTQILAKDNKADIALDFKIFNLKTNSSYSDFSPSFYGDKLLFSSGRPQDSKTDYESYLNIFTAEAKPDGQISAWSKPLAEIPEMDYHKATPYYSKGLNAILYVLSNTDNGKLSFDKNGKNALAIGMQPLDGNFRLLLKDLSTSFYYPFYDEVSQRLYFSANFEDGYGGTDIYYVYTNRGQIMSAPINLGPRINSPGNEIAPFVFENSFYFSSDVFYGLGGMDVYKSNMEEDTFSIPVNLGEGINSPEDDFGFIMRNDGEGLLGYFSSNRTGGKGKDDLYGFKVDERPGLRTLVFKGVVKEPGNRAAMVENAEVRLLDLNGGLLAETYSDSDGNYRLEIPWEKEVTLESTKGRYATYSKQFSEKVLESMENSSHTIEIAEYDDLVEEKENQTVVKLKKFFFSRNSTQLTPEIETELDKVVSFVESFPNAQLRVETYTDSRGGSSTNFRLTQKRSDTIKSYLLKNGVPESNILYSVGYGENKILNNCTNGVYCLEMLHQQNQRSLIVVLNDNLLFD